MSESPTPQNPNPIGFMRAIAGGEFQYSIPATTQSLENKLGEDDENQFIISTWIRRNYSGIIPTLVYRGILNRG